jgi:uncharacterized delta-60 repeat protein
MRMETNKLLTAVLVFASTSVFAQVPGALDPSFSGDGMVTTHFAPIGSDFAMGVAIQPNGRIVVAGSTQQDLVTSVALARYLPDGTLDPDFGTGGHVITAIGVDPVLISDVAMAVALQPDGKIVVVGSSFENGSGDRFMVARYDSTGELDPSFGTNGIQINTLLNGGRLVSVAIRDDGYIVAGGLVNEAPSNEMFLVARYEPDGTPDATFDGDGFATIDITADDDAGNDIVLEPGGDILITGYCGGGNDMGMALVRLAENGSLDPSLDGDGILITQLSTDQDAAYAVLRQPADGKILVGGVTTFLPMVFIVVARYNTDGSLDNTFAGDGIYQSPHPGLNFPGNMVLAPDGRIVIGGTWATNFLVAVVNSDGTADTDFDDDGVVTTSFGQNAYGNDIALDADGKAVLVGSSGQGAPTFNDFVVLRYHTGINVGVVEFSGRAHAPCIHPNPIGRTATLVYDLRSSERITIRLTDMEGRVLKTFRDGAQQHAGEQRVVLEMPETMAPGNYLLTISSLQGTKSVQVVKD